MWLSAICRPDRTQIMISRRPTTAATCCRRQLQLHHHEMGDKVLAAALAHMPCLQVDAVICSYHLVLGAVTVAQPIVRQAVKGSMSW